MTTICPTNITWTWRDTVVVMWRSRMWNLATLNGIMNVERLRRPLLELQERDHNLLYKFFRCKVRLKFEGEVIKIRD